MTAYNTDMTLIHYRLLIAMDSPRQIGSTGMALLNYNLLLDRPKHIGNTGITPPSYRLILDKHIVNTGKALYIHGLVTVLDIHMHTADKATRHVIGTRYCRHLWTLPTHSTHNTPAYFNSADAQEALTVPRDVSRAVPLDTITASTFSATNKQLSRYISIHSTHSNTHYITQDQDTGTRSYIIKTRIEQKDRIEYFFNNSGTNCSTKKRGKLGDYIRLTNRHLKRILTIKDFKARKIKKRKRKTTLGLDKQKSNPIKTRTEKPKTSKQTHKIKHTSLPTRGYKNRTKKGKRTLRNGKRITYLYTKLETTFSLTNKVKKPRSTTPLPIYSYHSTLIMPTAGEARLSALTKRARSPDQNNNGKPAKKTRDPKEQAVIPKGCLLYTSPSPRDRQKSRMPSSA